jgi:hypothetical protein
MPDSREIRDPASPQGRSLDVDILNGKLGYRDSGGQFDGLVVLGIAVIVLGALAARVRLSHNRQRQKDVRRDSD